MFVWTFFLRITHTIISQSNADSSWITLYVHHNARFTKRKDCGKFDIHMSVHHKYISKLQPTRCNVSGYIYFYKCCTCFRRFLRPSSGAQNCTYSFSYCQPILLLAASVGEMELSSISSTIAANNNNGWQYLNCIYSFVFLMMGGGTAWNM